MSKSRISQGSELALPTREELIDNFKDLARRSDTAARALNAAKTGTFKHPDGRIDQLGNVILEPEQLGLLAYLARLCKTNLSLEIGFGMGSSAAAILAARADCGAPFKHLVMDPYGLGRGHVVEEYLDGEFGRHFERLRKRSHVGLAKLFDDGEIRSVGLIFIDGNHTFEAVMADFVLSDALCCVGGYIVFDDALYPAIETVINYIVANRPDYHVSNLCVKNTTVLRKRLRINQRWSDFKPFRVCQRTDWHRAGNEGSAM